MKLKISLLTSILLLSLTVSGQEKPEPAGKIMDDAYKIATKENKSVMVIFHASWCGWCKKFEASINDPSCKDFFNKHFVIRYMDILERPDQKNLENPDATQFYIKYGGKDQGVPFFLIFDMNGKLLADSKIKAAGESPDKAPQNIGCPASIEEVTAFIQILEKAAKISDTEKKAITERFIKNKN